MPPRAQLKMFPGALELAWGLCGAGGEGTRTGEGGDQGGGESISCIFLGTPEKSRGSRAAQVLVDWKERRR